MSCTTSVYKKKVFLSKRNNKKVLKATRKLIPTLSVSYDDWMVYHISHDVHFDRIRCERDWKQFMEKQKQWMERLSNARNLDDFADDELIMVDLSVIGIDDIHSCARHKHWIYEELYECPFYVWGYYAKEFTNIDKMIEWLKTIPKDNVWTYNDNHERIEGIDDELIEKIYKLADKYGRNNLLFQCGF